jgi:seryl-tRNA synthetase
MTIYPSAPSDSKEALMFDPKWVRDHPELLDRGLKRRGLEPASARLLAIDEKRRAAIAKLQALQERRNAASKEIGEAKKAKDEARAAALMAEVGKIKEDMPALEEEQRQAEKELNEALAELPNIPADDVPDGADASANKERHKHSEPRRFGFNAKQHFDLGEALGLMDFETAAKLSGARFVVLKGGLAHLERALAQFMLDLHTSEHGYAEIAPPVLVRDEAMFGTAQLPKFKDDQFEIANLEREKIQAGEQALLEHRRGLPEFTGIAEDDLKRMPPSDIARARIAAKRQLQRSGSDLWLIPTAEVPLTNLVRESIVEESALPLRYTACTPCFRAEAGAAGKDTRGMMRQHQFTKVELVSITTPEQSAEEHERMLACAEAVLKKLDLPFRTVTLCTGDMGFAAQKTYDIEVWLPGEGAYREISSCSNCGEFQARRMDARYRPRDGKGVRHVHTLNGSGVAVGRALIAVLENYQDEGGAIAIPDALKPYMNGLSRIEKN